MFANFFLHVSMAAVLCMATAGAYAVCNEANNIVAPSDDTKVLLNFVDGQVPSFGASPGKPGPYRAFPSYLPTEIIKTPAPLVIPPEGGKLSYFEKTIAGKWRICRVEQWISQKGFSRSQTVEQMGLTSRKYAENSPRLQKMAKGLFLDSFKSYNYDDVGRLVNVKDWLSWIKPPFSRDSACFSYEQIGDDNTYIRWFVDPRATHVCPAETPDAHDLWMHFEYALKGSEVVNTLTLRHFVSDDGTWAEQYSPIMLGPDSEKDIWGGANADSKDGLTEIYGSSYGGLDNDDENMVVDSFGKWDGATYTFPIPPVPTDVLTHPDLLYHYWRRRQTLVDGQAVRLWELFAPDDHISRDRIYVIDGTMIRHEQYDAKGHLKRVITTQGWKQPRPGPHSPVNEALLTDAGLHIHGHPIFHRVYDFDAQGHAKLVAVSWSKKFSLRGKSGDIDGTEDLVFGTPDGKEKWRSEEDFDAAFGTTSEAAPFFYRKAHGEQ